MTLQELKEQVATLSREEKLALVEEIERSLQPDHGEKAPEDKQWQFLERRYDTWRKQLYIKGRRLRASTVWGDMYVNELTLEEAIDNWDLPLAAIGEAIHYCETHRDLIAAESEVDKAAMERAGAALEPTSTGR